MCKVIKNRILIWGLAVLIAAVFLVIPKEKIEKSAPTTIFVKAPESMISAFQNTFDLIKLDKEYVIEATDDVTKANFVVQEGMNKDGELIAYSPIVAVFNADTEYINNLTKNGYFVTSEVDSNYEDFDFNKVIREAIGEFEFKTKSSYILAKKGIISRNNIEFKVYHPSKDSDSWEEFYNFMLFTVNDGYYPNTVEEMEQAKQTIEKFLNSKYAEPFNNNTLERSNGIVKNSIYFMAYSDLARVFEQSGGFSCRIMYPKTVVYHSYYAIYDELGKVVYDSLVADYEDFWNEVSDAGYAYLRSEGYNTRYSTYVTSIGNYVYGQRTTFNAVEIPGTKTFNYEEEEQK